MVVEGRAVCVPRNGNERLFDTVSPHQQHQLDATVVRSPHVTIWPGRNMWHVKERLFRFCCAQLNRYKQALLFTEYQAQEIYEMQNRVKIPAADKSLLGIVRRRSLSASRNSSIICRMLKIL